MIWACIVLSLSGVELFAQTSGLTARQLYLQEDTSPAPARKVTRTKRAPAPKPMESASAPAPAAPAPENHPAPAPALTASAAPSTPAAPSSATGVKFTTVALHLGLRYNVLQYLDRTGKNVREVDPDTVFKHGDCIAVRFRPNRSGYFYVFNEGSSGAWQAMLPSPLMPEEANMITAGVEQKVPQDYCFQIGGPPGVDTLLVVLTEKQEDMYKLNDAIKHSSQKGISDQEPTKSLPAPAGGIGRVVMAMAAPGGTSTHLPNAADPAESALISRDLTVEKVGNPGSSGEPPNSVYVVKTVAARDEHMVIEIKLHHE